jgi:hypothetical protein
MDIEDKITIIEGPPPTFESVTDSWVLGLSEGPTLADVVLTRVRTFNGSALVERCHRAWRHQQPIYLEFRSEDGLPQQAPIVAARHLSTDDGDMLLLWLRMNSDEVELELHYDSDDLEDDPEDFDPEDIDPEDIDPEDIDPEDDFPLDDLMDFGDEDFEDFLDDDDDDDDEGLIDFGDLNHPRRLS